MGDAHKRVEELKELSVIGIRGLEVKEITIELDSG
jgi:hypothetical protein